MAGTWKSRFHEVIHGQQPGDGRRHIVWVVIAGNMHRCSVHSVRKVTERERLDFELCDTEDPATWKSLADMLPNHSYIDVTKRSLMKMKLKLLTYHLRLAPLLQEWDGLKFKPVVRHRGKSGFIPRLEPVDEQQAVDPAQPAAAPMDDVAEEAPAAASSSSVTPAPVNVYGDVRVDSVFDDSDEEVGNVPGGSGRPDTSSADPESER